MCGRYYIAEDDMADELVRIIKEINRKKTPGRPENLRRDLPERHCSGPRQQPPAGCAALRHALGIFVPEQQTDHQRALRDSLHQADVQGRDEAAALPDPGDPLLRVGASRREGYQVRHSARAC